jgi:hypothetical protein
MAFVLRTKRRTSLNNHNTPAHIGPGAYSTAEHHDLRVSYAPFASSSDRGIDASNDSKILVTPSAGEYQPEWQPNPQVAVSSTNFVSRVPRFNPADTVSPGPGAYPKTFKNDWVKRQARPRQQKTGNLQWVKASKAPSSPSFAQSYGYEEKNGVLTAQKAPDTGHTGMRGDVVGVGEYTPYKESSFGAAFQGVDFGRSIDRTPFKKALVPGPGEYNHEVLQTSPAKMMSTFASNVQRSSLSSIVEYVEPTVVFDCAGRR